MRQGEDSEIMSTPSSLEALAARISSSSKAISTFCDKNGHPYRSFARDSPTTVLPANAPEDLRATQQALIDAALEIQLLATDASEFLGRQAIQVCSTFSYYNVIIPWRKISMASFCPKILQLVTQRKMQGLSC